MIYATSVILRQRGLHGWWKGGCATWLKRSLLSPLIGVPRAAVNSGMLPYSFYSACESRRTARPPGEASNCNFARRPASHSATHLTRVVMIAPISVVFPVSSSELSRVFRGCPRSVGVRDPPGSPGIERRVPRADVEVNPRDHPSPESESNVRGSRERYVRTAWNWREPAASFASTPRRIRTTVPPVSGAFPPKIRLYRARAASGTSDGRRGRVVSG